MTDAMFTYALWALLLGAVSAVSLPLGSVVGLIHEVLTIREIIDEVVGEG